MAFRKEKEEQSKHRCRTANTGDERWEWLERGWRRRKSWWLRDEGWKDWMA